MVIVQSELDEDNDESVGDIRGQNQWVRKTTAFIIQLLDR
jgi:hypothetical protein